MLHTVPNIQSPPDGCAIDTMLAAMSGGMRSMLEARPSPATVRKVGEQLVNSVREGPNPNKPGHLGCGKASKNYTFITMPQNWSSLLEGNDPLIS